MGNNKRRSGDKGGKTRAAMKVMSFLSPPTPILILIRCLCPRELQQQSQEICNPQEW